MTGGERRLDEAAKMQMQKITASQDRLCPDTNRLSIVHSGLTSYAPDGAGCHQQSFWFSQSSDRKTTGSSGGCSAVPLKRDSCVRGEDDPAFRCRYMPGYFRTPRRA